MHWMGQEYPDTPVKSMHYHMVKSYALLPSRIQRNMSTPAARAVLKFGTFHNREIRVPLASLTVW